MASCGIMVVIKLHVMRGEKRAAIFTFEKNEKLGDFWSGSQHQGPGVGRRIFEGGFSQFVRQLDLDLCIYILLPNPMSLTHPTREESPGPVEAAEAAEWT